MRSTARFALLAVVLPALVAVYVASGERSGPVAALERSERLRGQVGYPTQPEAFYASYVRGHCSGHYTLWVGEFLTPANFAAHATRSNDFRPDHDVPAEYRAILQDYHGHVRYDRGHLAAAGNATFGAEAMSSTFLLSNMMPQVKRLNEGEWKGLESHVRSVASADGAKVWVFTGVAWLPNADGKIVIETIGPHAIWVPGYFWKAFYAEVDDRKWMEACLVPNVADSPRWQDCRLSVDRLESDIGLNLFPAIPVENQDRMEAARP